MPHAKTDDHVTLYYEETGSGAPVIFVHEFAGDMRSWEPQMRHFGQRHRAIAFNARGYPPSAVPEDPARYSQARAADDIAAVLDHLEILRAHVVGLSMGGFATLHFGFRHLQRALSLVVAGCGYGAEPAQAARFKAEAATTAETLKRDGMAAFAARYAYGPTRVQFEHKDPRGFAEFARHLAEALSVMPNCGHTINLEDPGQFNHLAGQFLAQVECGRWPMRDPRTLSPSITGMRL